MQTEKTLTKTSILLATSLMVATSNACWSAPQPTTAQGPIDIQANEQEFAGDQVIARGNVRVKYKDSIVLAPLANVMKDASGNPQIAVFTGHPHLTQGLNKIDAEKLTFEVSNSKVIAEGHAHSEVVNGDDGTQSSKDAENKGDQEGGSTSGSGTAAIPKNEQTANAVYDTKEQKSKAPDKIITDSDRQEYERSTGKFAASGHVRVVHGDILVKSNELSLVYGLDGKPETAVFTGSVAATQGRNTTLADKMIYQLQTRRLQANGHVKSTVIQEHRDDDTKKKSSADTQPDSFHMTGALAPKSAALDDGEPKDDIVVIISEAQDFSDDTGRMSAVGNVKVFYEDMIGAGPSAIVLKNIVGKAERIIFKGRSQITQPGKRWIADHLEMLVADNKVLATGNTRAVILKQPQAQPQAQPQVQPQVQPQEQLAGRPSLLSASKIELPK